MARFVIEVSEDTPSAKKGRFVIEQPKAAEQAKFDPTEGMSTFDKVAAGAGKAMYDLARGVGQLTGVVSRKDIEEARKLDAPLMETTEGKVGNFIGAVTPAIGTVLIPGVNTMTGAALTGAASGLLQPSASTKETLTNVAAGTAAGPAGVAVGRAIGAGYQGAKALAEPFFAKGQEKIAARVLQEYADDPIRAAAAARAAQASATGALPTTAEATKDVGLAQLQRALQSTDPTGFASDLASRQMANNAARVAALREIAKTPEARAAAVAAADRQAKQLYGTAFQENVEVTPELLKLASRPSMRRAEARAVDLADELSIPFSARLDDMRPKQVPLGRQQPAPSFVYREVDVPGSSMPAGGVSAPTQRIEESFVRGDASMPRYFEVPPVESVPVRDMHTIKMGMDALMGDPTLGIAGREAAAVARTREQLMDMLPESYQVARRAYIEANKPVNQMDVGRRLLESYSSATKDLAGNPKLRAESFNRALQDEEKLVKLATGLKGDRALPDVMTPDQLRVINSVADDLSTLSAVEAAGRAPGSPTAQNLASQNVLRQLLGPTGLPQSWSESAMLQTLLRPVQFAAKAGEPRIVNRLAQAMMSPEDAAVLLQMAQTPGLAERFGRVALPYMVPLGIGAQRALND